MIIETSKSQQIPQEITYGENLVKLHLRRGEANIRKGDD